MGRPRKVKPVKPKMYDVFGYEIRKDYTGMIVPERDQRGYIMFDGTRVNTPDPRIPKCRCGCPRESHSPQEGNWICHGDHKGVNRAHLGHGGYCWNYNPDETEMSVKEQFGKLEHWNDEINDYPEFISRHTEYQMSDHDIIKMATNEGWDVSTKDWKGKNPATKKRSQRVATSTTDGALGSAHTESRKPKKAMNSSRAKNKICPRCDGHYTNIATSSRRDNKTSICSKCGTTEGMLDTQPMIKIATTLLLEEEKFQKKLGLDYYAWLKVKREREMSNG